jgi:FKBP-type peptidyl-prolyl cis-trans isomerase FklB
MKIRNFVFMLVSAAMVFSSCNKIPANAELKTEIDSVSYWIGLVFANNLKEDGFEIPNSDVIARAFDEVFNEEELLFEPHIAQDLLMQYYQKIQESKLLEEYQGNKYAGELFLEENQTKEGVVTLPSGLQYKILVDGDGPKPALTDVVRVHYKGSFIDGNVFESSFEGDPVIFGVNGVITGWTEALQLMTVGSKWELYIPQDLAYGTQFRPGSPIQPFSALIFEVELIAIEEQ